MYNIKDYTKQKEILRELAKRVLEISKHDFQKQVLKEWKALNALKPIRPMFTIDQLPWSELNIADELACRCEDPRLRAYEMHLRETIYRWEHMPDDRVTEPVIYVSKSITVENFGTDIKETIRAIDEKSDVVSHAYIDQLQNEHDIEKIRMPIVTYDKEKTAQAFTLAQDLFHDILEIRTEGVSMNGHVWDKISTWHGIEECMVDLVDRPAFMHKMAERSFLAYHVMLDQYEELGLITPGNPIIHCGGAYTDELIGYNHESPGEIEKASFSARNSWTYGAAQLFSMVSPAMHDEFDIEYSKKWFERFGLGYYGCCEPLHHKVDIIRKISNIRKISMSPWSITEKGAENIGGDYVFSAKPNPAFLANDISYRPDLIQSELENIKLTCHKYGCPVEFLLKDVSTVGYVPQRLFEWVRIADSVCDRNLIK